MTRDEAIESLIDIKNEYLANYGEDSIINILIDEYDIQAIDMAIQALEQEPCEDAISRQAVLENAFAIYTHECGLVEVVGVATIKDLPSVKPQERTGHWIKTIGENGITSAVRCSECGFEDNRYMLFRYCPDCGTKMVKPQEGEE